MALFRSISTTGNICQSPIPDVACQLVHRCCTSPMRIIRPHHPTLALPCISDRPFLNPNLQFILQLSRERSVLTMISLAPIFLLAGAIRAMSLPPALLDDRAAVVVSPNKTCGMNNAGLNNGFTCDAVDACCSKYGFCGSDDAHCLTTAGCQASYSNTRTSCTTPRPGVTVSIDGTCGTTGVGTAGYRCPATGMTCCSAA